MYLELSFQVIFCPDTSNEQEKKKKKKTVISKQSSLFQYELLVANCVWLFIKFIQYTISILVVIIELSKPVDKYTD